MDVEPYMSLDGSCLSEPRELGHPQASDACSRLQASRTRFSHRGIRSTQNWTHWSRFWGKLDGLGTVLGCVLLGFSALPSIGFRS